MTQPPSNDFPNGQVPGGQEPQVPDFGPPADPAQPSFDPTGQPGYAAPGAQQPAQGNQDYWEANAAQQPPQGVFDQAPKKKGILGKVGSIVVALLVAFGAYTAFQNFASDAALEPGNCLVISGESNDDVDHKLVDCDDADTYSYYVASVSKGDSSAGTCEGVEYESTVTKRGSTKTKSISCLIPQFTEGKCYTGVDESIADYVVADCTGADYRITKVADDAAASCEAPAEPWSFSIPARTYCIEILG